MQVILISNTYDAFFSWGVKAWIFITLGLLTPFFSSAQVDSIKKSPITLSTNALSFFGGHIGPEFRANIPMKASNRQLVVGYRLALGVLGFESSFPEDDLAIYRQSFKMAHDLTVGIKYNSYDQTMGLMPFFTFGRFAYEGNQTVCLKSVETTSPGILGYCACEEVGDNTFTEVAYRFGVGLELQYTFLTRGKWSFGASGAFMLSIVNRERLDFLQNDSCPELNAYGGHQPNWGKDASFWLHGIPYTTNQRREESSTTIRGRLGLWINYQL